MFRQFIKVKIVHGSDLSVLVLYFNVASVVYHEVFGVRLHHIEHIVGNGVAKPQELLLGADGYGEELVFKSRVMLDRPIRV